MSATERFNFAFVDDAAEANCFMLSRANIQRDFADDILRQTGSLFCANSLLEDEDYVEEAKKAQFGIALLENTKAEWTCLSCCEELYAASRAGVKLTKIFGCVNRGDYLYVKVTDQVFSSEQEYEEVMRETHGDRYTPFYHTAKLQGEGGKEFTCYCLVPSGRAASATGADRQHFPKAIIVQLDVAESGTVRCRSLTGEELDSFRIEATETAAAFRLRAAVQLHVSSAELHMILPNGSRLEDLDTSEPMLDLLGTVGCDS